MKEFRTRLEELAARNPMVAPDGLVTEDWHMSVAGRSVRMRSYVPSTAGPDAMLYMHGGGWMLGSIEGHDQVCADLAHGTGLRVISVDYALAPENRYPVALEECLAAASSLSSGSSPIGAIRHLWLGGDSAGGNLALSAALRLRDTGRSDHVDGLFLVYPCTNPACASPSYRIHADAPFLSAALMRRFWSEYLGGSAPDIYSAPARASLSDLPQTVLLSAALDPLIDESDALAKELRTAAVEVDYIRAEGLIHGLLRFRHTVPAADQAFKAAVSAIARRLM